MANNEPTQPKNTKLEEEIYETLVEHGVEPHACGQKECEANRQTVISIKALTNLIRKREKEAYKKGYAEGAVAQYNEVVKASKRSS